MPPRNQECPLTLSDTKKTWKRITFSREIEELILGTELCSVVG
jgi:hypothetical protein